MTSSDKPYPGDELEQLIRAALQDKTNMQAPPDRIWRRIRRRLLPAGNISPGQFFTLRSSLVVQIIVLLMVLSLGGLEMRFQPGLSLNPTSTARTITYYVSSANEALTTQPDPASPEITAPPVIQNDAYLFNAALRRELAVRPDSRFDSPPPLAIPPTDVIPHILSPEGRTLMPGPDLSPEPVIFFGDQLIAGVIK